MEPLVLGLNHCTAPLAVRERVAVPPCDLPTLLRLLRAADGVEEAVILSTCNRVEFFVASSSPSRTFPALVTLLCERGRLAPATVQSRLYALTGRETAAHLFRVTAGLDSMVLGESEITVQVKQAYRMAHAHGATGPVLNRLFQKALHSTKLIRTKTRIAEGHASIGSVVAALAQRLFADRLRECKVLLWGAGKAAEATARHLIKSGIGHLWIVNRTQTKAQDLALMCQGGWLSWEQAMKHLAHVDIAIVCTQAPHHVIDSSDMDVILPARGARPLVLLDLAVPRNVDPSLKGQPGLHLYNVDDLQAIAETVLAKRRDALKECEALVEQQVDHFFRWDHAAHHKEVMPCECIEA